MTILAAAAAAGCSGGDAVVATDAGTAGDAGADGGAPPACTVTTLYEGPVWGATFGLADGVVLFGTYDLGSATHGHTISTVAIDGGAVTEAWRGPSGMLGTGIAVGGGKAFWSGEIDWGGGVSGVFSAPLAGGSRTLLGELPGLDLAIGGVALDADTVDAASETEIVAMPAAGGGPVTSVLTASAIRRMVVRDRVLYYLASGGLFRRPLATVGDENLAPAADSFEVDARAVYFTTGGTLVEMPLDGSASRTLVEGLATPGAIAVGPDAVYVTVVATSASRDPTSPLRAIARIPLATPRIELVADELEYLGPIATDGDRVCYAEDWDDAIVACLRCAPPAP